MDGLQFEHRCAELLRYRGFHKVAVTKGSGDQGVDILAQKNGIKYGIQCNIILILSAIKQFRKHMQVQTSMTVMSQWS